MAIWAEGLVPASEVVAWADREILGLEVGMPSPVWLSDLALEGPGVCSKRATCEFIEVPSLTFEENLAIRVRSSNLADDVTAQALVKWICLHAMGEDLTELVRLCYHIDHLWSDCGDMCGAKTMLREKLPQMLPRDQPRVSLVLEMRRGSHGSGS